MKFENPTITIQKFDFESVVTDSAITIARNSLKGELGEDASIYTVNAGQLDGDWSYFN